MKTFEKLAVYYNSLYMKVNVHLVKISHN